MRARRSAGQPTRATRAGAKTILCIDDNASGLEIREAYLQSLGYNVLTATTGKLGLIMACSTAVDLVLLDYQMPGMDGGDVARWLREARPDLPVIMVSGLPLPKHATLFVHGSVSKGQSAASLGKEVERFLRRRHRKPS